MLNISTYNTPAIFILLNCNIPIVSMYFQSENQSGSTAFIIKDNSVLSRTRVKTKKGQIYALRFQCPLNMVGYFSSFSSN